MADDQWNQLDTSSTPSTLQLILTNGQSVEVMFVGAPSPFDAIFLEKGYTLATPELVAQGKRISKRAAVNLYLPSTGGLHVFEQSTQFLNDVRMLRTAHPFESSVFTITRTRVGDSTRHAAAYSRPALPRERSAAASLPRHDLARWVQQTFGRPASAPVATPAVSVVLADRIAPEDAAQITSILASLHPAASVDFLGAFAVATVADLPVAQTGPALRYAFVLRSEYPLPAPALFGANNNIMYPPPPLSGRLPDATAQGRRHARPRNSTTHHDCHA
nr:hypothetical protein [Deltaproteobacteria bacterium]